MIPDNICDTRVNDIVLNSDASAGIHSQLTAVNGMVHGILPSLYTVLPTRQDQPHLVWYCDAVSVALHDHRYIVASLLSLWLVSLFILCLLSVVNLVKCWLCVLM